MAQRVGIFPTSVQFRWAGNEIKSHLTRTFKLSRDPHFEAKFWDVIGLYLNPPTKAFVLCRDDESRCQALERTQPGLPMRVRAFLHPHPRQLPPWDGHLVRAPELPRRTHPENDPRAADPFGMARLPQGRPPQDSTGTGPAADCRQLRHPKPPGGA